MQLYNGQNGTVYASFGRTHHVIKLDLLLPKGLRGLPYEAVKAEAKIGQYFELASLVLISAEAMQAHLKSVDMTGVTEANPVKLRLPALDPDHLRIRNSDGALLPQKTQELFSVVAAYWEGAQPMGMKPGLVAALWRRGMAASDIIRTIQMSTGPNGEIVKASGRGHDIMQCVIETYLTRKGLAQDAELPQSEMANLVERWLTATRSAPFGSKDSQNTVFHWSEYRRLGLVDQAGVAQLDQVRRVADKVFSTKEPLTFRELSAWVDHHHRPVDATKSNAKAARALLKKKRKQGKLNRKRGRR